MKNFIQPGNTVDLVAPSDVLSGGIVHVGAFLGVAAYDASSGQTVPVQLTGVFELPKAAVAINQGDICYWTGTAVTNVNVSGEIVIGACTESVLSGATTVRVRLKAATPDDDD